MEITVDTIKEKHPEVAEHFKAEGFKLGAKSELERIKGVQALTIPGHEKLISSLAYDGETSPESAALKIMTAEAEKHKKIAADTKADAGAIPKIDTSNNDTPNEAEEKSAIAGIIAGTETA